MAKSGIVLPYLSILFFAPLPPTPYLVSLMAGNTYAKLWYIRLNQCHSGESRVLLILTVMTTLVVLVLRGGSLRHLGELRLRYPVLAFLSLAIQLVIFPPNGSAPPFPEWTTVLYAVSMLLIGIWTILNRHIPGIVLVGIGLVCNLVAILANGGYMPVDPDIARVAGLQRDTPETALQFNSIARDTNVHLWILTDILPVPAGLPFHNVYSIGDVLLTCGLCWCLIRTVRKDAATDVALQST